MFSKEDKDIKSYLNSLKQIEKNSLFLANSFSKNEAITGK